MSQKETITELYSVLLKKIIFSSVLGCLAYAVVEYSDFYYLFIGNVFLTLAFLLFLEALIEGFFLVFKKWKSRRKNLLSSIRITIGLLFIVEIVIRFAGLMQTYPERADGRYFSGARAEKLDSWYWVHTPNDTISNPRKEFVFYRTTNSLGLSEKEISVKKSKNIRILALGDSFTEGVGLAYEKSWVKQMETRWKDKGVETINAGIGGSDPVFEFALYRDKLRHVEADIVLLTINTTDVDDIAFRGGFERFKADGTAGENPPSWEWVYAANHLARMFIHGVLGFDKQLSTRNSQSKENQTQALKVIEEVLAQLKQLTAQRNAKLLIVVQPSIRSFENGRCIPFYGQEEIKKYLKSNEIDFVDASQSFLESGGDVSGYFWPLDTHFNEKGYALFGKTIYEKMEELKWLEK